MALKGDPQAFIRDNTKLISPALVPEVRLWLAAEDLPLWRAGEEELEAMGLGTPYWAFAWAGGQALARYVLDHKAEFFGRKILCFAAGSGIEAIACAQAMAGDVVASDIDPMAATAMALNALANDVFFTVSLQDYLGSQGDWDIVLIGDVCYEQQMAGRVQSWARSLAASGRRVLIGDPVRAYLERQGLEAIARYPARTTSLMEDTGLGNATVWEVRA